MSTPPHIDHGHLVSKTELPLSELKVKHDADLRMRKLGTTVGSFIDMTEIVKL